MEPLVSPRIIAVEGIDASGKSTQTDLLAEHFTARGLAVEVRSFPRYDSFFGRHIRALLDGTGASTAHDLDPRSMALWFAMDRWQSFTASCDADVLLLNRYTLSNAVYQASRLPDQVGDELFSWILDLEHRVLGLPEPQLTVVLDVDVDVSSTRAAARAEQQGATPDVYERATGLLTASRRRYRSAGEHVANLHVVDVTGRTPGDVAGEIRLLVS